MEIHIHDAPSTVGDLNLSSLLFHRGPLGELLTLMPLSLEHLIIQNCLPDENGFVLLGQFTTDGILSGYINLRGQDANGDPWEETGIPIPQIIPGCTDSII